MLNAPKASHRKMARTRALQALYSWHLSQLNMSEIEADIKAGQNPKKIDFEYMHEILHGVLSNQLAIEAAFSPFLSRPLKDLDPIELAVLRLSSFELMYRIDVPYRVVINEALELAKTFGSDDSHKFVNSVLDKLAKQVRQAEMQ